MTLNELFPSFISNRRSPFFLFNPNYLVEQFTIREYNVSSGSARNLWYPVTKDRLEKYSFSPLIGIGPGMYSSYAANQLNTSINQSIYNIFGQRTLGLDTVVDSQIIPLWGELGYIGISIFVLFFIYAGIHYYKLSKILVNIESKALSITASASCIYIIFGFYINHILEEPPTAFPVFLFMGLTEITAYRGRFQKI
jgi:hypothetical protein